MTASTLEEKKNKTCLKTFISNSYGARVSSPQEAQCANKAKAPIFAFHKQQLLGPMPRTT